MATLPTNVPKVVVANLGGSRSVMRLIVVSLSFSKTITLYIRSQQVTYNLLTNSLFTLIRSLDAMQLHTDTVAKKIQVQAISYSETDSICFRNERKGFRGLTTKIYENKTVRTITVR